MKNFDFVAIDFETATYNRLACQVGIVVVKNGEITERISRLIQPPHNYFDPGNVAVHHISPDDTADAPTFDQLWPEISPYFIDTELVAHNALFDKSVLLTNLDYYNIDSSGIGDFTCTCELYNKKSLDDLCVGFDIPTDQHHDALFDAECCAKFYLNYLNGIRPNFSAMPVHGSRKNKDLTGDILVKDLSNADPNNPFYDRKVVITGDFCYDRKELAVMLKDMGADINTSVSKKTDIVLVGSKPGPAKMKKIEDLINEGYPIKKISQKELIAIFDGNYDVIQ